MSPYKDTAKVFPLVLLWIALAGIILVAVSFAILKIQRPFQNAETDVLRGTNQYQASVQQHLVLDMQAVTDIETRIAVLNQTTGNDVVIQGLNDQRHVTLLEMRKQAATILPGQVPSDVTIFLAQRAGQ